MPYNISQHIILHAACMLRSDASHAAPATALQLSSHAQQHNVAIQESCQRNSCRNTDVIEATMQHAAGNAACSVHAYVAQAMTTLHATRGLQALVQPLRPSLHWLVISEIAQPLLN